MSSSVTKAAADRHQRQLLALLKEPGNDVCADCKVRNPRWASWDQGVFICVQCASMHRKLGSHITKVKSLTLDTWTKEQVENMRRLGNLKVNASLNPDERRNPPPPPDSGDERNSQLERFIRNKYERHAFASASPPSAPPSSASNGFSATPSVSLPPPPRRSSSNVVPSQPPQPSQEPAYAPPPFPPPAAIPQSTFAPSPFPPPQSYASSAFAAPQSLASNPPLPPRPAVSAPPRLPKSVRFGDAPATIIPDSDDEDDEPLFPPPRPRRALSAASSAALPRPKSVLRPLRPGEEIPVDWAALTRDSSLLPDVLGEDEEDVPLATLGALGMRGAQAGMVGTPGGSGIAVPYGYPAAMGPGTVPGYGAPPVAPLQPQYTGSAKGYLHQQRAEQYQQQQAQRYAQPAPLQPQMTGSVPRSAGGMGMGAFQQMFQPPPQPSASPNPFLRAQQQQQQQAPSAPPQPPQLLQPQPTGPGSGFFARPSLSPSPQPPSSGFLQPQPTGHPFTSSSPQPPQPTPLQPQATATQRAMSDIWADLDLLGRGSSFSAAPAPSATAPPAPSPSLAQPTPQALRPQLTGFVPGSSFGQQLARESGGANSPFQPSSLTVPATNAPSVPSPLASQSPSPAPLQPQRTGFVPSSAFGQSLLAPPASSSSPAPPAPLQPQRMGFVPSSNFGQQLAQDLGGGSRLNLGGPPGGDEARRAVSPGPFDFSPSSSPAPPPHPQQQYPPATNPFSTFSSSLTASLPPSQPLQNPSHLRPQPTGYGSSSSFHAHPSALSPPQRPASANTNPFMALTPQATGFVPFHHQQQQQGQPQSYPQQQQPPMQPQPTGYGAGPPGGMGRSETNPFLAMQQQQQQGHGGAGWGR
ncbi:hypothetical protein JCM11641_008268 [Rhodosporidiobolus odoratus]